MNPTDDEVKQALEAIVTSPTELNLPLPAHFHSTNHLVRKQTRLCDVLSEEEELSQSYREDGSLSDDIKVALSFLDNRERKVLSMRFGIGAVIQ